MTSYIAEGLSRRNIREYVKYIRRLCGLENALYFPVAEFLELLLPKLVDDLNFEVIEYSEMRDKEGETIPSLNTIRIRGDVYDKATEGDGRARFTILHEIGHLLLHDNDRVALCRVSSNSEIKAYENPEWQADAFAGEMLMAEHLIRDMSIEEIAMKCGASYAAASYQYNQIRK